MQLAGKTTRALIDAFKDHRFRLSATATPAPSRRPRAGTAAGLCRGDSVAVSMARGLLLDTVRHVGATS